MDRTETDKRYKGNIRKGYGGTEPSEYDEYMVYSSDEARKRTPHGVKNLEFN